MQIKGTTYNYQQFMQYVQALVEEGTTSGNNKSEALVGFTALNFKRMERLNKTIEIEDQLLDKLGSLGSKQIWIVISEAWCGDSAQCLPAIAKIAEHSAGLIDLQIILRDENPEWIEKYHTNGSKSIPKLISFNTLGKELFTWGPRPETAQQLLKNWKANTEGKSWDDFEKELHTWYAKDKTLSLQKEFYEILSKINETNPVSNLHFFSNN